MNVEAGGVWVVAKESLITNLTVAEGSTVYGEIITNADGSLTLVPSANTVPAGTYGSAVAIGGAGSVGGGVTADGVLDVEAAANAVTAGASAEP